MDAKAVVKRIEVFGIGKYGSISAFARALDVKYDTLRKYLKGENLPRLDILEKLEKCGADLCWILFGHLSCRLEMKDYANRFFAKIANNYVSFRNDCNDDLKEFKKELLEDK